MTISRRKGDFSAHFAPFFGLPREGLSPRVRGFFEPSTMKSSSSSRAPRGVGVAGSLDSQVTRRAFLLCYRSAEPKWSTCCCMANTALHIEESSDACAHGGDMSSRASQWPCPQPPTAATTRWRLVQSTTAYRHRRRTGPGRLRTELYGDRSPEQPGKR